MIKRFLKKRKARKILHEEEVRELELNQYCIFQHEVFNQQERKEIEALRKKAYQLLKECTPENRIFLPYHQSKISGLLTDDNSNETNHFPANSFICNDL